jgi:predicted ATPase
MSAVGSVTIRGFRSIRELQDFKLRNLNILIGANGSGKSNFVSLFKLVSRAADQKLQRFVQLHDGPDGLLFGGRKRTEQLEINIDFDTPMNGYGFALMAAGANLIPIRERNWDKGAGGYTYDYRSWPELELRLGEIEPKKNTREWHILKAIQSWREYHFHDTSLSAAVRQEQSAGDTARLKPDAGNLAAWLYFLHEWHPVEFRTIERTIRMVAPFFGRIAQPHDRPERIELKWYEDGDPDTQWGPRQLSDGTLRFICLATLLLQPPQYQPDTIIIDEPELGLHPYALGILSTLMQRAAERKQLIVSTQSVDLVNDFDPEDVVVVNRRDGASTFNRLDAEQLKEWLEDYTLGDLWKMNVIGGRPSR